MHCAAIIDDSIEVWYKNAVTRNSTSCAVDQSPDVFDNKCISEITVVCHGAAVAKVIVVDEIAMVDKATTIAQKIIVFEALVIDYGTRVE